MSYIMLKFKTKHYIVLIQSNPTQYNTSNTIQYGVS